MTGLLNSNRLSIRFQYALNFRTCPWSLFSSYLHDPPSKYQTVLNLKPACSTGLRFHPTPRMLLGQAHFFDSLFDICRNL